MKKRPAKVQRRVKNMRDKTKRMIAEMLIGKGFSKINAKRASSYTVKNSAYSYTKTFTVYALTSTLYHRKKQKAMLLEGKLDGVII